MFLWRSSSLFCFVQYFSNSCTMCSWDLSHFLALCFCASFMFYFIMVSLLHLGLSFSPVDGLHRKSGRFRVQRRVLAGPRTASSGNRSVMLFMKLAGASLPAWGRHSHMFSNYHIFFTSSLNPWYFPASHVTSSCCRVSSLRDVSFTLPSFSAGFCHLKHSIVSTMYFFVVF